jgi:hypothetical protein
VLLPEIFYLLNLLIQFLPILPRNLIDVELVFNVLLLLLERVLLNEIPLRLNCKVLVIQPYIVGLCCIDKLRQLVFHVRVLVVGGDRMCDNGILILVEQAHNPHALVFFLLLLAELFVKYISFISMFRK